MRRSRCQTGALIAASAVLSTLLGCGSSSTTTSIVPPPTQSTGYSGAAFTGKAIAGQQPLIGAAIQLYTVGTTGNGSAPTALLSTALTTDSSGAFSIPCGYSCPSSSSLLYLMATSRKPGPYAAFANSAIAFLTAIGTGSQCHMSSP